MSYARISNSDSVPQIADLSRIIFLFLAVQGSGLGSGASEGRGVSAGSSVGGALCSGSSVGAGVSAGCGAGARSWPVSVQ